MADTEVKQYISKIVMGGVTYDIKDAEARAQLSKIVGAVGSVMAYRGKTTTPLTDGATTSPIKINNADYTPEQGDVVAYLNREYAWNGSAWAEFGSTGSLKALAFADSASGKVSIPTTTHTHSISVPTGVKQGSVSASGTYTPDGVITVSTNDSANPLTNEILPEGTNASSAVTLEGGSTGKLERVSFPKLVGQWYTIPNVKDVGTKPSLTVTNKNIPNVTSVGKMFQASVDAASETLTLTSGSAPTLGTAILVGSASGWNAGSTPTLGNAFEHVAVGDTTYQDLATGAVSSTGTGATVATALHTGGTAAAQKFTGIKRSITFAGTSSSISVSGSTSGVALTSETKSTGAPSATTDAMVTVKP